MGIAVVVFLVVTGLIVGVYLALTALPGRSARRQLDRRLRDVSDVAQPQDTDALSSVVRRVSQGPLPAIDRMLAQTKAGAGLPRLIEQSGVKTTPSAMVIISLLAGAGCGFAAAVAVRLAAAAVVAAVIGGCLPFAWLARRRRARLRKFEEQFPEALDLLSRAIRAGHAFQTALGMAANELPAPVGPELKKTFEQQNFGLPLREVLTDLSERIGLLDVRFFVTAVMIQRETGGNLSEILDNLSHVVRERFKILRQVRVHTAHGRFTGYVLLALPAFLAVALSVINPEHMASLFREHIGQLMLVSAVVMQAVGYVWIRKVIKIEV